MKAETLRRISLARRIIIISIAVYIVLFFIINASQISADNIMRLMYDFECVFKDKEASETITFEDSDNNFFTVYKNGFVSLTNTGVSVYNENNIKISEFDANYSNSVIKTVSDGLFVFERGGNTVYRTNSFNVENSVTLEEKIINLSSDNRGYTAVITDEYGYRGNVTVYNKNFEELFFWKTTEEYPIYTSFMNDTTVAVISVKPNKENTDTVIRFLNFVTGEETASFTEPDSFPEDIFINSDKTVDVLTSGGIFKLTTGSYEKIMDNIDENISNYSIGDNYVVQAYYSDKAKNISSLNAYNKNGNVLFTKDFPNLKAVAVNKKYIFVSSGKTVYALDNVGNTVFEKEIDFYIQKIVAADNGAYVVGNDSAVRIFVS